MSQQTPPTMRVAVELGFVIGCADCLTILESTAAAAFRDQQVTRFVAMPGKKHAHVAQGESGTSQHLEGASDAYAGLPESTAGLFPLPISDTNGSNPEDVMKVNGLDPEGRQ